MRKIGLQMYTVREAAKKDVLGTIKAVAAAGYAGIEMGMDYGGLTVTQMRAFLDDLGLTAIGMYVPMLADDAEINRVLHDCSALGAKYCGVAWMGEAFRNSAGLAQAGVWLQHAARLAKTHDIDFVYHAHAFEFEISIDGKLMLDALLESTDPQLLKWELDTYWVKKGGQDPVAYFQKYSGRTPLCHLKDMTGDGREDFEIVGEGILDFEAIFKAGDAAGVDWYIVEQDTCPKGEFESMRASYNNIRARGWLAQ
jgi:sugar phosphate isomerase/epimerase